MIRDTITASGWVDVSYQMEGIIAKISTVPRSEANGPAFGPNRPGLDQIAADNRPSNRVVKLKVTAERPEELDTLLPKFLDFPVAAIRSPPIRSRGQQSDPDLGTCEASLREPSGNGWHFRARLDRR